MRRNTAGEREGRGAASNRGQRPSQTGRLEVGPIRTAAGSLLGGSASMDSSSRRRPAPTTSSSSRGSGSAGGVGAQASESGTAADLGNHSSTIGIRRRSREAEATSDLAQQSSATSSRNSRGSRPTVHEGRNLAVDDNASSRSRSISSNVSFSEPGSQDASPKGATPASREPFGLSRDLFEYITHREQNGEAFAGYRVLGHPMILQSLVDGSPLVSLHLKARNPHRCSALVARRPDAENLFQGVLSADNQTFELIMTNLTTEDVIMFDIGGDLRAREEEYWNLTDKTFWSGRHRNDARLNRSNILWPMQPNACAESNLHFQQTGERRRLVLRAQDSLPVAPDTDSSHQGNPADQAALGYPLWVYPKHGSRTSGKFARTQWTCPETIIVVGTPALLHGDITSNHNIQLEAPVARPGHGPIETLAESFGFTSERLLEILGVDRSFLSELPPEMQQEILTELIRSMDPSRLREEISQAREQRDQRDSEQPQEPSPEEQKHRGSQPAISPASQLISSSGSSSAAAVHGDLGAAALGARPAQVTLGGQILGGGAHRVLIERFDFVSRGAPAVLALGVNTRVMHITEESRSCSNEAEDVEELCAKFEKQIGKICAGRTDALRDEVENIYATSECVICLSSDPPPDCILYQCGHRCAHLACVQDAKLKRCPLCRSPVVALLPCS